jgi:protein-tyrosine-phosphatase
MNGEIDLVLCFERRQVAELMRRFPNLHGKVFLLSRFIHDTGKPLDIPDPHGATEDIYLSCFKRIEKLVDQISTDIAKGDGCDNISA